MVHVRVRHHDMGNGFAFKRRFYVLDMLFDHRAGVDHGDLALADHVGIGADMGEGARVFSNDPPDTGRDLGSGAVFKRHFFSEGYLG